MKLTISQHKGCEKGEEDDVVHSVKESHEPGFILFLIIELLLNTMFLPVIIIIVPRKTVKRHL